MGSKVQNIILGVLSVGLIGLTVAYALLTQQLKIESTATVKAGTWDIHFENLSSSLTGKAALADTNQLAISSNSTTISGSVGVLSVPGDSIVYTFDIVNKGNIPAILSAAPVISTPTCTSTDTVSATNICTNDLVYTLTYADGSQINNGDTLAAGETKKAKLTLSLKNEMSYVPSADVAISNIAATLNYSQN